MYCTCPSDKTSRAILRRALGLHFLRIKFLRGGLAAWKMNGYPVEPYKVLFTSTLRELSFAIEMKLEPLPPAQTLA